jgi:hypothetical protein
MTNKDRDRIRKKQDRLLSLAAAQHIDSFTHISNHPASPRLGQLEAYIWPEWEDTIDWAIKTLTS